MLADDDFEAVVRDRIAGLPPFAGGAPAGWRIDSLGGMTNRTVKLSRDGESYVLRLPGEGTDRYIDRAAEADNAAVAVAIGLCPEILFFDPADGTMVARFVENAIVLDPERLRRPEWLEAAARTLGRLHRCGRSFRGEMRLFPMTDAYLALAAGGAGEAILAALGSARAAAEPVRIALDRCPEPLAPCHIDPAPHNFLVESGMGRPRRTYLVDWEYSAMSEPIWDLAGLSVEAGFDPDQDALMLEAHGDGLSPERLGRLALYKVALDLLAAAWGAVQIADGNPNADFRSFVGERLERFRAAMAAPSFGRHLDEMDG